MSNQVHKQTSLEYRTALDAASVWLAAHPPLRLICDQKWLHGEALQRLDFSTAPPWQSILWIEPQLPTWEQTLEMCTENLPKEGRLAVIVSQPLAKHLPNHSDNSGQPLGFQRNGMTHLILSLRSSFFQFEAVHNIHSYRSILTNQIAQVMRRMNSYAMADRLKFSAKQHYIQPWKGASRGTCALILATRK